MVAGHDGIYLGWTASASIDDATATTVAVVANLASPSTPGRADRGARLGHPKTYRRSLI